jgi:MFS family permease
LPDCAGRPAAPLSDVAGHPRGAQATVLAATFAALAFAGVQLGLMALASLSVTHSLMNGAYTDGAGGDWFGRYTAAIMLGAAIGGIFLGGLGDRIGRVRALALSILSCSLFGSAGAFVTDQGQLLVLRFLAGLGVGGVWPNGVALVSEFWANLSRPMAAGVMGTAINVGILCVSQAGRLHSVTPDSWRWLILVSGLPGLLTAAIIWLLPESPVWLAHRASPRVTTKAPVQELFHAGVRRRTLVGMALGAIPLIGAWAASKWMIPWADKVGGAVHPGYKAATQGWWALGAIVGSFFGPQIADFLGRRITYFLTSLFSAAITCGIFVFLKPLDGAFLPAVFIQGTITTLFFGWLPLYLPELFPTRVRAAGTGITYNCGRFAAAAGVLFAGTLMAWTQGNYAKVGVITGAVYALGMIVIWWAPDTTNARLAE